MVSKLYAQLDLEMVLPQEGLPNTINSGRCCDYHDHFTTYRYPIIGTTTLYFKKKKCQRAVRRVRDVDLLRKRLE
ncbi:hypothetical protein PC119_g21232 [Phytophthora cactorum]|nr:hypothetical protein PC119_g21232 [Phytophthora cactorum]KAG3160821.1 hypothetical protein PC128_g20951 [Phytophthora cactorum]